MQELEQPSGGADHVHRIPAEPEGPDIQYLDADPVRRGRQGRTAPLRHAPRRVHALRLACLRQGLPVSRRPGEDARGCGGAQPHVLHRLQGLHRGVPLRHPPEQPGAGEDGKVHAVLRPHHRGQAARVRDCVPHGLSHVRPQGGDGREGPQAGRGHRRNGLPQQPEVRDPRAVRAACGHSCG